MTNPLRVAIFNDSPVFAGTERHIFDLALGMLEAGVDVRLACPPTSALAQRAEGTGLPMVAIENRGRLDFKAVSALADRLKAGDIDLVHTHNGRTALLAALAVKLAGRGRAVTTQHFLEPAHCFRRGASAVLSRLAHRWVNRQTSHFVTISEAAKIGMLTRGQAPEEQISVAPNGMPTPDLSRLAAPEAIREELGIPPQAPLIVSVARLAREKNLDTLIAAMKEVVAVEPSAICLIAGIGAQKAALLAQIASLGLVENVKLIGFRNDALAIIRAGDLFVLPSAAEPFGLVLIEAMSIGRPVIATRAGGPAEIIADHQTGRLVPPCEAGEMARAILTLVRDRELRRRMGEAGHLRFLERYTVDRMVRTTLDAYRKALAK